MSKWYEASSIFTASEIDLLVRKTPCDNIEVLVGSVTVP